MSEASLRELSDAAQSGVWHTVDAPWGSGDWIVSGNPDPHAGLFVCIFDGAVIGYEATDAYHADPAENAAFVASLVNAYRAGHLHDATALAEAEARERRAALEEADDREVNRILAMSDQDVIAEIEAEGRDPQAIAETMRGQMGATFKLCEEITMLRTAAASLLRHVGVSRYRCARSGLRLDANIPEYAALEAALANTTPETRQSETEAERCIACGVPFKTGDRYLPDASGGSVHRACCGPEPESFTHNDEPLPPGAALPEGAIWTDETTAPADHEVRS